MKNSIKYRNPTPLTISTIKCPACNKKRLKKYANDDGTVTPANTDTVTVREEERYLEVCVFCVSKYREADEKFIMENMKKLSKAFDDKNSDSDGESTDHKDFSLN